MQDLELIAIPRYPIGGGRCNSVAGLFEFCREWVGWGSEVVEIGTYDGVSTATFARFASRVITIDIDRRPSALIDGDCRVERITGDSLACRKTIADKSVDIVYLDGDHSYECVAAEIVAWMSTLRRGGIMAGHDFHPSQPGVMRAVTEQFDFPDRVYSDSTWMVRLPR